MKITNNLRNFIKETRAGVLAVIVPEGKTHAAAILYTCDQNIDNFYFATQIDSEKCQLLKMGHKDVSSSFVIGTESGTPFTIQHDGILNIVTDPSEKERFVKSITGKHGKKHWSANYTLIRFTPLKGKFTDYSKGWDSNKIAFNEDN